MIELAGLTRTYGAAKALDAVNLVVSTGTVHGLLGPNGAGKTTLCKILSTVLLPTAGTARVLGHDVVRDTERAQRSTGIVFGGDRGLYGRLSATDNLRFWGSMYGLRGRALGKRVAELLDELGLDDRAHDRVDRFSRGMKQRLHLARGLVADPPVLILDEPTVGMDPVAAHEFRALVHRLRADGRTVLLTTHDMAEAQAVCDEVTLIDNGTVLASGPTGEIGRLLGDDESITASGVSDQLAADLTALDGVTSVTRAGTEVKIVFNGVATEVLTALVTAGVTDLRTDRPTLEETYLRLIGGRGMRVR